MDINMLNVIPGVQKFVSLPGNMEMPEKIRIVIPPKDESDLMAALTGIVIELSPVLGRVVGIHVDTNTQPGDIFCEISSEASDQSEGYTLDIDTIVDIRSAAPAGIFYGLQTLRQLLLENPARLPKCRIVDFPYCEHRGIMLDVGRKYWNMTYLHQLMQRMARLKLNMLHLHFTEWNAFRLQSDQNIGLAAEESYSKEDIIQLQTWADQYHITLVPEIDLPGHATIITQYKPSLRLDCESMSKARWAGGENGGWTINFVDPGARQWMRDLISEFAPLFTGPYFHIGTDEIPDSDLPSLCPRIVEFIQAHGYSEVGDAFVDWINEMNELVRSYGKQMQIWSWWDRIPHSIAPEKNIVINSWVEEGASLEFLEAGYSVVHSSENELYLTPGLDLFPDNDHLYHGWRVSEHPKMLGYKICVWANDCEDQTDNYFEALLRSPRAILAERCWNSALPTRSLADFLDLAERVGVE